MLRGDNVKTQFCAPAFKQTLRSFSRCIHLSGSFDEAEEDECNGATTDKDATSFEKVISQRRWGRLMSRQGDDSDDEKPLRPGNNQYGARGIPKCYNCRMKKFKVRSPKRSLTGECEYGADLTAACRNCVALGIECGRKLSPTEFKQQQQVQDHQENTRAATEAGMIDFSNSSPRTQQVLRTVLGITQAQLQNHAAATPEVVYYGVATQLMAHYPQTEIMQPVATAVQPAPLPMSTFPAAGSPTITHGGPHPYPSMYSVPPGVYTPYHPGPTSAPIQSTPGYGVPSTSAGVSPAGSPISPHQAVPGQQPWHPNWYTHYHQQPPGSVSPTNLRD